MSSPDALRTDEISVRLSVRRQSCLSTDYPKKLEYNFEYGFRLRYSRLLQRFVAEASRVWRWYFSLLVFFLIDHPNTLKTFGRGGWFTGEEPAIVSNISSSDRSSLMLRMKFDGFPQLDMVAMRFCATMQLLIPCKRHCTQ
ncbi:hypothetical protein KSP40_PGU017992 [Platanthera guangdongensis]|uniref:Uncharacterized protein n=1 Tax=Platanthera guangdongensis TaxID=2320717 RepID=A0ABR2LUA9_9ASPA